MVTQKEFYTIPEIARLMGVSRVTIYRQVKTGHIPAVKIGRSFLIKDENLAQVLGNEISPDDIKAIGEAVKKGICQYRDVFKWLAKE